MRQTNNSLGHWDLVNIRKRDTGWRCAELAAHRPTVNSCDRSSFLCHEKTQLKMWPYLTELTNTLLYKPRFPSSSTTRFLCARCVAADLGVYLNPIGECTSLRKKCSPRVILPTTRRRFYSREETLHVDISKLYLTT